MRSLNSLKNFIASLGGQLLSMGLRFITRTVFIYTLSEAYLGINGLFSSILSVLNMAELGVGSAILYALYKPTAEEDAPKVRSIMLYYRRMYFGIGCVIVAVGMALIPALPYLMKETTDLVNIRVIYVLYLLDTAASYWFFAYKQNILTVHQKDYINAIIQYICTTVIAVVQAVLLFVLRKAPTTAFYAYTVFGILGNIVTNVFIKRKADRTYPQYNEKGAVPLTKEEKQPILKNVVGLMTSNVSGVALNATDNILISAFISVGLVGVYSNYILLRTYVSKIVNSFFNSLTVSVANFCATESRERQKEFFDSLFFLYFWVFGFCAISFWMLYDHFIAGIWLHDTKWLLPRQAVFFTVLNFLLDGLAGAVTKFRVANGLHWQARYRYLFSAVFNVGISYLLLGPLGMGITGVILGTTASILIMVSYDPVIVFKNVFAQGAGRYYLTYIGYLVLIFATGAVVELVSLPFAAMTAVNCVIRLLICILIPNVLWYILFRKNRRFVYLRDMVGRLARTVILKIKKHNAA